MTPLVYLYVHDTMADWEPAFLLPELVSGRFFKDPDQRYQSRLCGRTLDPITTMGGIKLVPEITFGDIQPKQGNVLILPGSNTWMDPVQDQVLEKVRGFLETDILTGAICGATMGLARAGLLNNRPHTSNDLAVLKTYCSGYTGDEYYISKPAVTDGNLITASGFAAVEFAYEILKKLGVMREETITAWYNLNVQKKPEYFYQLMDSLKK
ncbi:type 1 glutamine amidotransferase family protein [Methanospirillum stamsii]|uniref:Glutamine amidotransferase n=1 Tax=Methanospirillum stamsii TaxID=1277351 RepID=A0A2V2N9Z4_9EURY|nr:type 1 glutamine amidotransferase family protein [Methanospirillum stamsii]PWR73117.1 glutamine amidotransferase [Methanospirillum stamsii]